MRLRIRDLSGGNHTVTVPDDAQLGDLRQEISKATGLSRDAFRIKAGYPPLPIEAEDGAAVAALSIRNGDTIILEKAGGASVHAANLSSSNGSTSMPNGVINASSHPASSSSQVVSAKLKIVRRKMEDDNSCLFSAIAYVLENKDRRVARAVRETAAGLILSKPEEYSEAMLGKSTESYCDWLLKDSSWGGGIELAVLSKHYEVEIAATDIQTLHLNVFGEAENFNRRVYVIYDGIHYDALVQAESDSSPEKLDITVFSPSDKVVENAVIQFAAALQKSHQFTNLSKFTLSCCRCGMAIVGQKEAQAHAIATGHSDFEEYQRR